MKGILIFGEKSLSRISWIVALLATTAAISLHAVFLTHAGGLWRDEAGVVRLATLPMFGETWKYLGHETCPLFFPMAIRLWSALGLGSTDLGLRVYGFLIGLLLLGAVWFSSWKMTRSAPLISLALLAVNSTVVRWGDSLRAYGTGSVLMLLTIALVWQFVISPSRGRWLLAALAALCSVQCLFQNAFMLLAVCIAGSVVCLQRRDKNSLAAVLAIGLLAAASLAPYMGIIQQSRDWLVLEQTGFLPSVVWINFSNALASAAPWTKWLWIGLGVLVVFRWADIVGLGGKRAKAESATPVVLYAATALIAGALSFFIYLHLAALPTQVWYYLPLITFAAVCLDAALVDWLSQIQIWRHAFLILVAGVSLSKTFEQVQCPQTNMDRIAAVLRQRAAPNDLILVHPWYCGVSFDRYFTGKTPWTTIPELADHRFHRYDLFKKKMQMQHPIQPVLDRIASTLQAGNRIWLVGFIPFGEGPADLGPAPNKLYGWLDGPYSRTWGATVGHFIAVHAEHAKLFPVQFPNCPNSFENLPLVMVVGWRPAR